MSKVIAKHIGKDGQVYLEYEASNYYKSEWKLGYDSAIANGSTTNFPFPDRFSGAFAEGVRSGQS